MRILALDRHCPAVSHASRVCVRLCVGVDGCVRACVCVQAPSAEDMERLPFLKAVIDESLRLLFAADVVLRTLDRDMVVQDGKV